MSSVVRRYAFPLRGRPENSPAREAHAPCGRDPVRNRRQETRGQPTTLVVDTIHGFADGDRFGGARMRVADGVGITLIGFIGSDAENGRKINSGVIPVRRADGLGAGVEHVPDCA